LCLCSGSLLRMSGKPVLDFDQAGQQLSNGILAVGRFVRLAQSGRL